MCEPDDDLISGSVAEHERWHLEYIRKAAESALAQACNAIP